jgi:hypothetical protein
MNSSVHRPMQRLFIYYYAVDDVHTAEYTNTDLTLWVDWMSYGTIDAIDNAFVIHTDRYVHLNTTKTYYSFGVE